MKIKIKFTLTIISIIVVSLSTVGFFTNLKSSQIIMNQTEDSAIDLIKAHEQNIIQMIEKEEILPDYLVEKKDVLDFLSHQKKASKMDKVNSILKEYVGEHTNIEHVFLVNNKGVIIADSSTTTLGKNISDRKYCTDTIDTHKAQISETIQSKDTGAQIVVFTHPIIDSKSNKFKGFIGTGVYAKSMAKYLKGVELNDNKSSYAYLVDEKGVMIYHPDIKKIGQPVANTKTKDLVKRVQKGEKLKADIINYVYNGVNKIAAYAEIPQTNWILTITGDERDIKAPIREMNIFILLLGVFIIVISSAVGMFVAIRISRPISKATELINKTARLDLVNDSSFDSLLKCKDETGGMTRAMAGMRQSLREMITLLKKSSDSIMNNADEVEKIVEKVHENCNNNSSTTQELSAGMEETAASTEEISASIEEIEGNVGAVAEKTKEGTKLSEEIAERADTYKDSAIASKNEADNIYLDVKAKMEEAVEQAKSVNEINMLADVIMQITEQTSMLSLNAAIEAARVGEAGRGFAVVADEIKKLAEQSSKTAGDIQKVVSTVYSSVDNLKGCSERVLKFIDDNVSRDYQNFIEVCNQYDTDADLVNEIMEAINQAAEELNSTIFAISKAINEVAGTVNEGATGITDIAQKTSDTVVLTEDVQKMSEESVKNAKVLGEIVSRFKVD